MLTQSQSVKEPVTQLQSEFIKVPKLYVTCTQKFKPNVMLNFLSPLGAQRVTGNKKDHLISFAEVMFDSCINAEKAFAIWHCRFAVPFQGRIFFTREPNVREIEPSCTRLQVDGFPTETSEIEIFGLFRSVGVLYSCIIEHSKKLEPPVAIVHYLDPSSSKVALEKFNGVVYHGHKIKVHSLSEQIEINSDNKSSPLSAVEIYRISVKGFPVAAEVSFKDFFSQAGTIINCQYNQENGTGTIEFETAIGAFNAINRFNNFKLKDSTIEVKNLEEERSKPHVISLYSNNDEQTSKNNESFVPASRNASQSRWAVSSNNQVSSEPSKQNKKKQEKLPQRNGSSDNKSPPVHKNSENGTVPSQNTNNSSLPSSEQRLESPSKSKDSTEGKSDSRSKKAEAVPENSFKPQDIKDNSNIVPEKLTSKTSSKDAQSITKQQISESEEKKTEIPWEEFKNSQSYELVLKLTKGLSLAAEPIQENMLKNIYSQNSEIVRNLAQLASNFNSKLVAEESVVKSEHYFYLSDDAYHNMIRSCDQSNTKANLCDPEYFPLYPNKEALLKQLMNSPAEEGQSVMATMIEKRLKEMEIPDHSKISKELAQKCTLRLLMVSYYYDDVLVDLLQKYYPHLVDN